MVAALTGTGNVTTNTTTSGTSVVVAKPANVADNDIIFANVRFQNSGATILTPSGWTLLFSFTTNWSHAVFYKVIPSAAAETDTSYTFAVASGSARWAAMIFRVTGANASSPIGATGSYSAVTGTTSCVIPSITAPSPGLLLAFEATNVGGTGTGGVAVTPPAGMSAVGSSVVDNGAQMSGAWTGQEALGTAGATGTRTLGHTPTASNSGGLLVHVKGVNIAPTATVTGNQTVAAGATASITVTPADPDGSIASQVTTVTRYTNGTAPASVTVTGSTTTTPSWTAGSAGSVDVASVLVTDDGGLTVTVTTEVRVASGATSLTALYTNGAGDSGWTIIGGSATEGAALGDGSSTTRVESPDLAPTITWRRWRLIPATSRTGLRVVFSAAVLTTSGTFANKVRLYSGNSVITERATSTLKVLVGGATADLTTSDQDLYFDLTAPEIAAITDWGSLWPAVGGATA